MTTNDIPSRSCWRPHRYSRSASTAATSALRQVCYCSRCCCGPAARPRARQRRQERDPWRRKQRCGNDLCVVAPVTGCRHGCRCWMPDRIATRPRGGPPCARRTDPCGDRVGGLCWRSGSASTRTARPGRRGCRLDHSGAKVDQVLGVCMRNSLRVGGCDPPRSLLEAYCWQRREHQGWTAILAMACLQARRRDAKARGRAS